MDIPETNYVKSGDIHIAYQVTGSGPPDLVWVPGFTSNVETVWDFPEAAHFIDRLSSFCRLIRFDKRGTGLSDRAFGIATLEDRMDDVRAVLDAVDAQRVVLFGQSEGAPMSILFTATYPDRIQSLILYGAFADGPRNQSVEQFEAAMRMIDREWGSGLLMPYVAPSKTNDKAFARMFGRFERSTATPAAAIELARMNQGVNVVHLLPAIHVPTVVLHRSNDKMTSVDKGRYIAKHLSGAKFVELSGSDHYPFFGDSDSVLDEIEEFLTGSRSEIGVFDQVLATVLFTDIVDSTRRAAELGDHQWRSLLDRHDMSVRQQFARFRGREVKNLGDGFLATFDGPARAVRCACAIAESVQPLGIAIRSGLHTGEIEIKRDDIAGIAVHIASRIAHMAEPGIALVSSTVRDLVAGSGLRFDDRGSHTLRGVPEPLRLFAAVA